MSTMEQIKENLKSFLGVKKLRDFSELLEAVKKERMTIKWKCFLSEEQPPIAFKHFSLVVHREIISEKRIIFVKIQTTNLPISIEANECTNMLLQHLRINNEIVRFFAFDKIEEKNEINYKMNMLFLCTS